MTFSSVHKCRSANDSLNLTTGNLVTYPEGIVNNVMLFFVYQSAAGTDCHRCHPSQRLAPGGPVMAIPGSVIIAISSFCSGSPFEPSLHAIIYFVEVYHHIISKILFLQCKYSTTTSNFRHQSRSNKRE